ncbi:Carbonyl reductase [NADPH] 1 [Monoraphidium neglectum]|uniref:Carbonyl reductase [NADPH] 1 n=1 Tax=Monoraphidium neglectum TaxID=145388 RepID=A0A0D2L1L6_9CHLO|nr:Carbonyl reductase [NADPH] 1 [Monoraphidium neglectum]KIZ01219.1 Carbonyl reductase [NADPH] 1 [Monoraphidium neglectum]|eukprot:XP_013900238.1 Carbonyl reductase [NADPH] 1 [Monoraphidium neglectum]
MASKWWSSEDVAVVTGANKGIGYEIARLLAEAGFRVIVTARNPELGAAALEKLKGLPSISDPSALGFERLDISDKASIEAFKAQLEARHPGRLVVLVNNAGVAFKGDVFGAEECKATIDTNFRGTADACEALAPLLAEGRGRIINVSSGAGDLSRIPGAALRAQFESPVDRPQLEALADKFVADIKAGSYKAEGWPASMYGISKALETAYTRVLAKQLEGRGIMVNAVCPGWCATDMSSWGGPRTAAQGADTPVWLATLPPPGVDGGELVTGAFWRDRQRIPF